MTAVDAHAPIYVGLDVSQTTTAVCAVGANDEPLLEASVATDPKRIADVISRLKATPAIVGLEAGGQSEWLARGLRAYGLSVAVLEAVRVRRYASVSPIKSDRSDAQVIARLLKGRLFREVHVKSPDARAVRTLLVQRQSTMVSMRGCKNSIRGALRAHGVVLPPRADAKFTERVHHELSGDNHLSLVLAPQLELWEHHRSVLGQYDRLLADVARSNLTIRLLQTMPGVGEIVATAFWCTIDDPWRFRNPRDVGAYIGLTPFLSQSGDHRVRGGISRHGDSLLRGLLFMGARTAMFNSQQSTDLLDWAARIRERRGPKRAAIALARRMSVVLVHMWRRNEGYQPRYRAKRPAADSLA